MDGIRQVLKQNSADIWVLTETHDDLAPPDCLNYAHSNDRPKNWSGIRSGSRWVSIWSRYPIIEQIWLDSTDHERTVVALLDIGNSNRLLIYGTVLPWKGDRQTPGWSEHHRVIPQQCAEWQLLRKRYPNVPLCVVGDYNSDMGDGTRYGTKQGIAALRSGLKDSDMFCATSPDQFPEGLLETKPIDHLALPIGWYKNSTVVAAWPADKTKHSDHSGLVVEVGAQTNRPEF